MSSKNRFLFQKREKKKIWIYITLVYTTKQSNIILHLSYLIRKKNHLSYLRGSWAQYVHMERTRNQAIKCGRKCMVASLLDHAEPHGGSPGWQFSFLHTGPFAGGLLWTGIEHIHGGSTPGRQWLAESEHGPCWAPWVVHRDRWLHCTLLPQPPRGRYRGCQHTRIILVLVWRYWTVWRRSRVDLSGPHEAV